MAECSEDFREYREEILDHLEHMEKKSRPDLDMIMAQPEINWGYRNSVLEFMLESHTSLDLSPETLFLAVSILDRYSSKRVVLLKHFQLVGITSLWIASKYVEQKKKILTLQEIRHTCCNLYSEQMVQQMELHILNSLSWEVGHGPTPDFYIDFYLRHSPEIETRSVKIMSLYLCECWLFQECYFEMTPEQIARTCIELSRYLMCGSQLTDEGAAYILFEAGATPSKTIVKRYTGVYEFILRFKQQQQQQMHHTQHDDDYEDDEEDYDVEYHHPEAYTVRENGYYTPPDTDEEDDEVERVWVHTQQSQQPLYHHNSKPVIIEESTTQSKEGISKNSNVIYDGMIVY